MQVSNQIKYLLKMGSQFKSRISNGIEVKLRFIKRSQRLQILKSIHYYETDKVSLHRLTGNC
jgi:hypothetical protein